MDECKNEMIILGIRTRPKITERRLMHHSHEEQYCYIPFRDINYKSTRAELLDLSAYSNNSIIKIWHSCTHGYTRCMQVKSYARCIGYAIECMEAKRLKVRKWVWMI